MRPSPPRGAPGRGRPVGIIDIGSNSIRLVVYNRLSRAAIPVANERVQCGLGRGIDVDGRLREAAMECARTAVVRLVHLAETLQVEHLELLATAATRDAKNGSAFLTELSEACGHPITSLDGADEARLSALGVASSEPHATGIVGDLGGGSLELIELDGGTLGRCATLPIGPLRLIGRSGGDRKHARKLIETSFDGVDWLGEAEPRKTLYAVGGTWRSLARIHIAQTHYPLRLIHGYKLRRDAADELCRVIAGAGKRSLAQLSEVAKRRIEFLPYAAMVMEAIMCRSDAKRVFFSASGLREGWLFDRLDAAEREANPLLLLSADPEFVPARSPQLGDVLFEWIGPLFPDETTSDARLRRAACLLGDMAWHEHPNHKAIHALNRILYLPVGGIGHRDRAYLAVALAVRYGMDVNAAEVQPYLALLGSRRRRSASILGSALRLGLAVSGATPALLAKTRLTVKRGIPQIVQEDEAPPLGKAVARRLDNMRRIMRSPSAAILD